MYFVDLKWGKKFNLSDILYESDDISEYFIELVLSFSGEYELMIRFKIEFMGCVNMGKECGLILMRMDRGFFMIGRGSWFENYLVLLSMFFIRFVFLRFDSSSD